MLWKGTLLNHIAIILVPCLKNQNQIYEIKGTESVQLIGQKKAGEKTFSKQELFDLVVLDLYFKKLQTVKEFWGDRDKDFKGKLGIAYRDKMGELEKEM